MMAFDFFSIASSVKAGSLGTEGAAGALSLAVEEKEETRVTLLVFTTSLVVKEFPLFQNSMKITPSHSN